MKYLKPTKLKIVRCIAKYDLPSFLDFNLECICSANVATIIPETIPKASLSTPHNLFRGCPNAL